MMTERGILVQDIDYLVEAAALGYPDAIVILSLLHDLGISVEEDKSKSIELAESVVDLDSVWVMYALAKYFSNHAEDETYPEKAFALASRACERNFGPAMFLLAQFKETGKGCEKDLGEAEELYIKAAKLGVVEAISYLGHAYDEGIFGYVDRISAKKYTEEAAKRGDAVAASELGHRFLRGIGVKVDISEALRWYEISAKKGNKLASLQLAMMYASGKYGAPVDKKKSDYYTRLANTHEQG